MKKDPRIYLAQILERIDRIIHRRGAEGAEKYIS